MNANNKNYSIRPLTEEEKIFAEEHYSLFFYIMRNNLHLNPEEWYDILIIPYLDAVKKYHEYESARQYAFGTVLKNKLYTAFTNEIKRRKRKKVIPQDKLTSLDYMLEGDNPFAEYRVEDWWIDKKASVEKQVILKELYNEFYNKCVYCESDAWGDDHINEYLKCELDLLLEGHTHKQVNKKTEKVFPYGYDLDDLEDDIADFRKIFKEVFGI